jgi:hypothetical protein
MCTLPNPLFKAHSAFRSIEHLIRFLMTQLARSCCTERLGARIGILNRLFSLSAGGAYSSGGPLNSRSLRTNNALITHTANEKNSSAVPNQNSVGSKITNMPWMKYNVLTMHSKNMLLS